MNRAFAAVAVASLSLQASALRKGSPQQATNHEFEERRAALLQQVAMSASDDGATNEYGCKFEVTNPKRCAEETAKKCTKMCKAPVKPWLPKLPDYPCMPPQLKSGCKVNCDSVAACKVRLRASLTGEVNTETYDKISIGFALQDYKVTHGHQLIKDFLQNASHKAILSNLISDILVDARGKVQERLDTWKEDFKGLLVEKLGNDKTFGDYSFLHGFVGNSTELVEALVPLSSFSTSTMENNEAVVGEGDEEKDSRIVQAVMEMPEARTYAELRFSHTMRNMNPLVRMAPGLALGALVAIKFPRVGVGLGAATGGLLWYFTELIADSLGPKIMGHSEVTIKAKLPEDAQQLGAPERLNIKTWFAGTSMYASLQALPIAMVQSVLRNLALEATRDPQSVKGMPVKVVDANFNLQADNHHIQVAPGSYGDVEATIDLSCVPNCPGPCGGIIRCG